MSFIEFVVCSITFIEFLIFFGYLIRAVTDRLVFFHGRMKFEKVIEDFRNYVHLFHRGLEEFAEFIADVFFTK